MITVDVSSYVLPFLPLILFWGAFAFCAIFARDRARSRAWWGGGPLAVVILLGLASRAYDPSPALATFGRAPLQGFEWVAPVLAVICAVCWVGVGVKIIENSRGIAYRVGRVAFGQSGYAITDQPRFKSRVLIPLLKCVPLKKIFEDKPNRNALVVGRSGFGKTAATNTLLRTEYRDLPKLIFAFKRDDLQRYYADLPTIDLSKRPFDAFASRPAFREAWRVANPVGSVGVMAATAPTLVYEAVKGAKNWTDYFNALENAKIEAGRNQVQLSTLEYVIANSKELAENIPDSTGAWTWDFQSDIVLDFSRLTTKKQQNFYAELIIRAVWDRVQHEGAPNPYLIFTDESHRLLTRYGDEIPSILDEVAREIRSSGGGLLMATQNLDDLPEEPRNQMATILCFCTSAKRDLEALGKIHPKLSEFVPALPPYACVDIHRPAAGGLDILMFKLVRVGKTLPAPSAARVDKTPQGVEGKKVVRPQRAEVVEEALRPEIEGGAARLTPRELSDLRDEVLRLLHERPYYVSELGRQLEPTFNKPAGTLKVDVHVLLKDLVGAGVVMKADLEDRWGKRYVLYWCRELGEGGFHRCMIDHAAALCAEFEIETLKTRRLADLAIKLGRAHVALECETGLKHDLEKFAAECRRRLKNFSKVLVVVPTKAQRARYSGALGRVKGVEVLTLQNLAVELKRAARKHG